MQDFVYSATEGAEPGEVGRMGPGDRAGAGRGTGHGFTGAPSQRTSGSGGHGLRGDERDSADVRYIEKLLSQADVEVR